MRSASWGWASRLRPASWRLRHTPQALAERLTARVTGRRAQTGDGCCLPISGLHRADWRSRSRRGEKLLDPALHSMMEAVHRYEGTVNQVLGDGIMALFGAPIAHEDHAARSQLRALAMQAACAAMLRRCAGRRVSSCRFPGWTQLRGGRGTYQFGNDLQHGLLCRRPDHAPAARMDSLRPWQHPAHSSQRCGW